MAGGSRFQTLSDAYAAKAIIFPANAAAATLLSLIGALDLIDSSGVNQGDISRNLHRLTAVRITGQAAAYLFGRTAATAVVPVTATSDRDEPVTAQAMINSFFHSTTAGTVAATAVVYFD